MQPSEAAAQGGARDPGGMLRRGYLKTDETHRCCRSCCMIGTGEGNLLRQSGCRGQNGCRGFRLVRDTSGCPGRLAEGAHCRAVVGHDPYQGRAGQGRAAGLWSGRPAVLSSNGMIVSDPCHRSVLRHLRLAPPPPRDGSSPVAGCGRALGRPSARHAQGVMAGSAAAPSAGGAPGVAGEPGGTVAPGSGPVRMPAFQMPSDTSPPL